MTLAASFFIDGRPIFMGDIMVSSPGIKGNPSGSLPTVDDISKYDVAGATQKVVIISEKVCLVWAGSFLQAAALVRYLRAACRAKHPISHTDFHNAVHAYPQDDTKDIDFIIYYHASDGYYSFTNSRLFELSGLKKVFIAGTGREDFIKYIEDIGTYGRTSGKLGVGQRQLLHALAYKEFCVVRQFATEHGFAEGWGGGFEIATSDGTKFFKLSNILYLFWIAVERENGSFDVQLEEQFLYQTYFEDEILFQYEAADNQGPTKLHLVAPPDDRSSKINPNVKRLKEFKPETIVSSIEIRRIIDPLTGYFVHMNAPSIRPVRIWREEKDLKLSLEQSWVHGFLSGMLPNAPIASLRLWKDEYRF